MLLGHHCHVKFDSNGGSEEPATKGFPGHTSSNDFADSSESSCALLPEIPDNLGEPGEFSSALNLPLNAIQLSLHSFIIKKML